ncbi:hypothetical protein CDES_07605 [Corynebacterium deserti GIMN1.010]|uniref:Uncharacterized protein n=1 Tax=Corynebacterium deserti GIMN1.010 TaxID=931089 RepID=A0A0M4CQ47_9CORY|nr:hypothetical protein [Corynebacterium deserti]ALC05930.1 hypothetical protein CDES_07605 [Corynebacterium deserti GIMN1.010]
MLIYATNIHIKFRQDTLRWLVADDWNRWVRRIVDRKDYTTLEGGSIPAGMNMKLHQEEGIARSVDIDLAMPKSKINRELREALFSISEVTDIEDIEITQSTIDIAEYKALHGIDPDPFYLVRVEESS